METQPLQQPKEYAPDILTSEMRLAELVDTNYMLLPVIERLGISLGFGEITVAEACAKYKVSTGFFLLVCNIHTYNSFMPSAKELEAIDPRELISYLHNSHEYYSNRQIPRLREKLESLVESCRTTQTGILNKFMAGYQAELFNHFRYEEETVFPYVNELASDNPPKGYSIETFEKNHDNIEEKLDDLKNIILKYLPSGCDESLRTEVLFDLYRLKDDLDKHTMMENLILIPLVSRLEKETSAR